MKYLIILLLLGSCAKVESEYVDVQIYKSKILYTNKGEPNILYTYVWEESNNSFWEAHTTDSLRDLSSMDFKNSIAFPTHIHKNFISRVYPNLKVNRVIIVKP